MLDVFEYRMNYNAVADAPMLIFNIKMLYIVNTGAIAKRKHLIIHRLMFISIFLVYYQMLH